MLWDRRASPALQLKPTGPSFDPQTLFKSFPELPVEVDILFLFPVSSQLYSEHRNPLWPSVCICQPAAGKCPLWWSQWLQRRGQSFQKAAPAGWAREVNAWASLGVYILAGRRCLSAHPLLCHHTAGSLTSPRCRCSVEMSPPRLQHEAIPSSATEKITWFRTHTVKQLSSSFVPNSWESIPSFWNKLLLEGTTQDNLFHREIKNFWKFWFLYGKKLGKKMGGKGERRINLTITF